MAAPIADARLSPTTSPILSSDAVGQAALYYTDGTNILSEAGPWPANTQRDAVYSLYVTPSLTSSGAFVEYFGKNAPVERIMHIRYMG